MLGVWNGSLQESSVEDEIKIQAMLSLLDQMFQRCHETLDATSHRLRCWINTASTDGYYHHPLQGLQLKRTERTYINLFKRFFCYVFRAWATPRDLRAETYGLVLNEQQEAIMSQIWHALDDASSWDSSRASSSEVDRGYDVDIGYDSDYRIVVSSASGTAISSTQSRIFSSTESSSSATGTKGSSSTPAQVVEWLFALSCQFVAQVALPGMEDSLPLVHFVGVLGIHSHNLVYRSAYAFTPSVAGLIWVCRLLMLEYALPLRRYDEINWPSRDSYGDQLVRLHYVRRKFLCRGSFHPTAYLFDVLVTGRRIAHREGRRTNISWSRDKEVLVLYNERVTMSAFRQMVWSSVRKCSDLLVETMFGWVPPKVDLLALHDDLTDNRPGWSVLKEPENHLEHSFRHLQRQAFTKEHLMAGGKWSLRRCQKYLGQVEELKKHLLSCIHFTGGLPGRATEVTIVKWCNTRKTMRNVFFYHGRAIIIVEYLKTRLRPTIHFTLFVSCLS